MVHYAILRLDGEWTEQWVGHSGLKRVTRPRTTFHQLTDQEINRLLVCGPCPSSGIDPSLITRLFREGIEALIHKVDVFNEFGFDPEVSHKRKLARQTRWRETNRDNIRDKRTNDRLEERIRQLKTDLGMEEYGQ